MSLCSVKRGTSEYQYAHHRLSFVSKLCDPRTYGEPCNLTCRRELPEKQARQWLRQNHVGRTQTYRKRSHASLLTWRKQDAGRMSCRCGRQIGRPNSFRSCNGFLLQRRGHLWQTSAAGDGVEEILTSPKGKTPTPSLGSTKPGKALSVPFRFLKQNEVRPVGLYIGFVETPQHCEFFICNRLCIRSVQHLFGNMAPEAIFLTVVPFLFVGVQSSVGRSSCCCSSASTHDF